MVTEVMANVFKDVIITRTSKLRKCRLKLGKKPTTEDLKHWIDTIKTKFDGK